MRAQDPTIFAWNLMNEPRCTGCGWALQEWIAEMSQYMKAIDPHHMVTIGEEGFYSQTCDRVFLNPGAGKRRTGIASSPWALMEGQDFVANHAGANVDFSTLHAWCACACNLTCRCAPTSHRIASDADGACRVRSQAGQLAGLCGL